MQADFLVAGEPGECERRDGRTVEVKSLIADVNISCNPNFLAETHNVVFAVACLAVSFKNKNRPCARGHVSGGSDSVSFIMGSDAITHIAS